MAGKPSSLYDSLNPDWVPSLKMGYDVGCPNDLERYNRLVKRRQILERQVSNKRKKSDDDLEDGGNSEQDGEVDGQPDGKLECNGNAAVMFI